MNTGQIQVELVTFKVQIEYFLHWKTLNFYIKILVNNPIKYQILPL